MTINICQSLCQGAEGEKMAEKFSTSQKSPLAESQNAGTTKCQTTKNMENATPK